jgi:hypothetical protein
LETPDSSPLITHQKAQVKDLDNLYLANQGLYQYSNYQGHILLLLVFHYYHLYLSSIIKEDVTWRAYEGQVEGARREEESED